MNSGFYTQEELKDFGFKGVGEKVLLSRKASVYMPWKISIGDNVRIDDFSIIVGNVELGSHIHISAHVGLHASAGRIVIEDFVGISSRAAIYAASDDMMASALVGPAVATTHKDLVSLKVSTIQLGKHAQVGTGSTLLPGANLREGSILGAMSLLTRTTKPWWVYFGIPARRIHPRDREAVVAMEGLFLS